MRATAKKFWSEFMSEPVRLQGAPDIIVTREWAYNWYIETGCDPKDRGFGSAEHMAFGRPMVDEPLTDVTEPATAAFLESVKQSLLGNRS